MKFDAERVFINVRKSETGDLLNRITVYRAGMEPEAIDIIETELVRRGVSAAQIQEYAERMEKEVIQFEDGIAAKCSFCHEPAVAEEWGWHRIWGKVPLFPRRFFYCREHKPEAKIEKEERAKEESQ